MGNSPNHKVRLQDNSSLLSWAESFVAEALVEAKPARHAEPEFSIAAPWRVIGNSAVRAFTAGKIFLSDAKKIFCKETTDDILAIASQNLEEAHELAEQGEAAGAAKRYRGVLANLERATFF